MALNLIVGQLDVGCFSPFHLPKGGRGRDFRFMDMAFYKEGSCSSLKAHCTVVSDNRFGDI